MDIDKSNKLIGTFMGLVVKENGWTPVDRKGLTPYSVRVRYHEDWDWLMEVVEKIEKEHNYFSKLECAGLGIYEFSLTQYQFEDADQLELPDGIFGRSDERCKELKDARLEVVYKIVVEFIKWYNEQNDEI